MASAGNGPVSQSWAAPASNGGVTITSYRVYRGTSTGGEALLTAGGCKTQNQAHHVVRHPGADLGDYLLAERLRQQHTIT